MNQPARPSSFEVEVEVFWCLVLDRLPPGRTAEVWLWRDWTLNKWAGKGSSMVGVFTKAIPLADFREACFETLEAMR